MNNQGSLLDQPQQTGTFLVFMGLSVIAHIILLAGVFFLGEAVGGNPKQIKTDFIAVDLVSRAELPGGGQGATAPARVKEKPQKKLYQKPEALPTAVKKQAAPSQTTTKTSLKQKTFKSAKPVRRPQAELDQSLQRLRQKVEKTPDDRISKTLNRLRQEVADKDKSVRISGQAESDKEKTGDGGQGPSTRAVEALDIYKLEIRYQILGNWVFPQTAAKQAEDLKTVIAIKIDADGHILDMWYDHRSGRDYYDESARKAILKSAPLPPLPEGYPTYTVGLEFTPSAKR